MTTLNIDLLDALRKAGVDEETARRAAHSVLAQEDKGQLATKADLLELKAELKSEIAGLKPDIGWVKWIITGGVGLYVLRSLIELLR